MTVSTEAATAVTLQKVAARYCVRDRCGEPRQKQQMLEWSAEGQGHSVTSAKQCSEMPWLIQWKMSKFASQSVAALLRKPRRAAEALGSRRAPC